MSCSHTNHATLRQVSGDPTNTEGIRDDYQTDMVARFRALRGQVRELVGYERDVLGLRQDATLVDPGDIDRSLTDASKVRTFIAWLRERLRDDVLEVTARQDRRDGDHWTATYIRAAYQRGFENATQRLQNRGVPTVDTGNPLQIGVTRGQLRSLYARQYDLLEDITSDMVPVVRDELTRALSEGVNPREAARRLTDEIEDLQRSRAETLARTEVINSYSEATLDRYERAGIQGVTVSGEFATADDDRVCPICEELAGRTFALDAMREQTVTFNPSQSEPDHLQGEYPVKPPVHPRCRCTILPVVS